MPMVQNCMVGNQVGVIINLMLIGLGPGDVVEVKDSCTVWEGHSNDLLQARDECSNMFRSILKHFEAKRLVSGEDKYQTMYV